MKLIDFGIASKIESDKTHVTKDNMMGTFNYMSPETFTKVKIGVKSDVWSLGCILYNMVYKKLPFADIKPIQLKIGAIISSEISFPNDSNALGVHDPRVIDVLKRCLIRDVSSRASIDELLKHPYLTGRDGNKNLDIPQLLSAIENLTPNTQEKFLQKFRSHNINAKPPPTYSQD